jgi:DNA-binding MarR family transcriptional regulator
MEAPARERGRLFVRPDQPRELRIKPRHLDILENVGRFRLATAAQLAALDGGSEQNVSRELLALWENGYVERVASQAVSRQLYAGSQSTVYGLTRKGAALLRRNGAEVRRRTLDTIDKTNRAGWRFVEHKVDTTAFMVALELAVQSRPEIALLPRTLLLDDAPKARRDRRVRLTAKVRIDGINRAHSVDPDEFFGLRFRETEEESYFMYECDRGEMPVERYSSKQQTYFAKKMQIYLAANREGVHERELGIPNFRVLTQTTTASRVEEMVAALERITEGRGSNMFLFTDQQSLAVGNALDLHWTSGKGERVRLED